MIAAAKKDSAVVAFLALGSNLGDRAAILQSAIGLLRQTQDIEVCSVSRVVETDPVGPPEQGPYLNAAVKVLTTLRAPELLKACLAIEQAHGRDRSLAPRWGPRVLDIDVLLFGDAIIDDPGPPRLRIPHPCMMNRMFVLGPLSEIAPQVIHPVEGVSIQTLRNQLESRAV